MPETSLQPSPPAVSAIVRSSAADRPSASVARTAFALLWISDTLFDLSGTLVSFAIGVWIFAQTGSAQDYSLSLIAAAGASMLVTPFAGAFADRYDRRRVVLTCDLTAISATAMTALAFAVARPPVLALYIYCALGAALTAIRRPALRVTLSGLVARERFAQVGGLVGISRAVVQIGAPSASGFLLARLGLPSVLAVEGCLVAACAIMVFGALTRARRVGSAAKRNGSIFSGARGAFADAFRYLHAVPLMRSLMLYGALVQCLLVLATAMLTPLVLSTHSSDALGLIMAVAIVGAMAGSMLVAIAKVQRRLMLWVLISDVLQCAAVATAGWTTSVALWCVGAFVCLFCGSTSVACSQALWMRKAPLARQGSIFALLAALNMCVTAGVLLAGGLLADEIFEPALREGGALAASVGSWFGTGKGRGIGLMFAIVGAVGMVLTLAALAGRRLRRLDALVADRPED